MRRMSLVGAILALSLLGDGCGLLCAEAFRGSRHLTQDCMDFPNTDQCWPTQDVVRNAVEKAKDEELRDLWIGRQECLAITKEKACGKDDRCVWFEAGCFCRLKELVENESVCLGLPDPDTIKAFTECPVLTSEDDCKGNDLCEWMTVVCLAKTAAASAPVAPEDKPKVCRLLNVPTECGLSQDKKACEKMKGQCEWVVSKPVTEAPEITCPAIIEAQKSLPPLPADTVDIPQVSEFCSPTQSALMKAVFEDKKVYKPLREAEKSCKGSC